MGQLRTQFLWAIAWLLSAALAVPGCGGGAPAEPRTGQLPKRRIILLTADTPPTVTGPGRGIADTTPPAVAHHASAGQPRGDGAPGADGAPQPSTPDVAPHGHESGILVEVGPPTARSSQRVTIVPRGHPATAPSPTTSPAVAVDNAKAGASGDAAPAPAPAPAQTQAASTHPAPSQPSATQPAPPPTAAPPAVAASPATQAATTQHIATATEPGRAATQPSVAGADSSTDGSRHEGNRHENVAEGSRGPAARRPSPGETGQPLVVEARISADGLPPLVQLQSPSQPIPVQVSIQGPLTIIGDFNRTAPPTSPGSPIPDSTPTGNGARPGDAGASSASADTNVSAGGAANSAAQSGRHGPLATVQPDADPAAASASPGWGRTAVVLLLGTLFGAAGAWVGRRTLSRPAQSGDLPLTARSAGEGSVAASEDHADNADDDRPRDSLGLWPATIAGAAGTLCTLVALGLIAPELLRDARFLRADLLAVLPLCGAGGFFWTRLGRRSPASAAQMVAGGLPADTQDAIDRARRQAASATAASASAKVDAEAAKAEAGAARAEADTALARADAARGELARATALIGALVEAQADTDNGSVDAEPDPQLADVARSLDDEEADILRALTKGPDRFRTESGVAARAAVPIDVVQDVLDDLEQQGYAGRIMSPRTGERLWYLTRQGRRLAATRYVV